MEQMDYTTAQELSMHMALCVCADYVHAWGLEDFLYELGNYVATEHDIADIEKAISAVGIKDDE
jgi:hypothetical protein